MSRWLYFLLIMAVIAPVISLIWGQQETAIFISSAIGLIPLAVLIGRSTEDLEYYVGPIAGGLLNATFGNAPEIIIGIFALQQGLISVVKASITGSIISNSLLVLGSSLAFGAWRWGKQYFSARDAGQYSTMMVLAIAGLLIPSAGSLFIKDPGRDQTVSSVISIILLLVYAMYLATHVFHLRTERRSPKRHGKTMPLPSPAAEQEQSEEVEAVTGGVNPPEVDNRKPPKLWLAVLMLLVATIGVAWNSELLVGAIKPVTEQLGWSPVFVGLVIIPIVGNAAEHSSALFIALRDHVDLSMAIAAGSSIQVATFVAPLLVLVSHFFPASLDLVFQPLELAILGLATILFPLVTLDGESTWLEGVQLVAVYVMACVVFFFVPG
jgi:Ca2+:H+ antiporter